jgi:hypothetical protein
VTLTTKLLEEAEQEGARTAESDGMRPSKI